MIYQKNLAKPNRKEILIVESEPNCAYLLQGFLESFEFKNIVNVSTGKQALKLLTNNNFALIFLALQLPDMSGIELCRQYQKICSHKTTPIICCSSSIPFISEKELAKLCFEAGMDDFLHKPVSPKALQIIMKTWFSNS